MSNRKCPTCGEEFSESYHKCPFCEEEEAIRRGKPLRRRGGKRLSKRKRSSGAGGVMMTVMAVVILGVLGYVYFGPQVAEFMGIRTQKEDKNPLPPVTENQPVDETPATDPEGTENPDGEQTPDVPDVPVEPAGPLALDHETVTIPAGQTARLTATGGTGEVVWTTTNEHIATVEGGSVTGKAGGTVTITATSGEEKVTCTVTVDGEPWVSDANLKLNKTDVTENASNNGFQLKVKGTDSPVVWASENTNVATVTADGWVDRVGKGQTNITATVDGQVLKCIVRCP